jgi:hypothetical protein
MNLDVAAVRRLEPDFWRAPSAHNTQPWTLDYREDSIEVGWDPTRALPAGDPTGRDLRLSLGAFVETCLIVCASAGLAVDFAADPDERTHRIGRLVGTAQPYRTPFDTAAIRARTTNRGAYLPGPVPTADLATLDGVFGGRVVALPSRDLAPLLGAADRHLFGDADAAGELRSWLRLTPRHPRYHQDGLTDRALDLGRAEATGLRVALRALPVLRRAGLPRLLAAAARGPLHADGTVLVLMGPADASAQVELGRGLMQMWLTLFAAGLACHPLSQIIDCGPTRTRLAGMLGVADPDRLLHITRVGRPAGPAPRSARRVTR